MIRIAPVLALAALACTPQSAVLTEGEVIGYLSSTTSFTLVKGSFDPSDVDENWNIDCRELSGNDEALRLEDPLDVCDNPEWPPEQEVWLGLTPYRAFREALEPWRGEGIITNEGDIQVMFHHRMPGGGDFRFGFAIDPDFQPTVCRQTESGTPIRENLDGDWVGEWSKDIDWLLEQDNLPPFLAAAAQRNQGGRLYYLNARAFQWDPLAQGTPEQWPLPEEWRAGFANGQFVDERLNGRYNRFGTPEVYLLFESELGGDVTAADLYYAECLAGETIDDCQRYRQTRNAARTAARNVNQQLAIATPDGAPFYQPLVHSNEWRPIDARAPGLDAWVEIGYSWVMLNEDTCPAAGPCDLSRGDSISGSFSIVLDAEDSLSRFIVQGDFEVDNVKRDRFGPPDLRVIKAEEAGDQPCAN